MFQVIVFLVLGIAAGIWNAHYALVRVRQKRWSLVDVLASSVVSAVGAAVIIFLMAPKVHYVFTMTASNFRTNAIFLILVAVAVKFLYIGRKNPWKKLLKIIAAPASQAPDYVRDSLVGAVMPIVDISGEEIRQRGLMLIGIVDKQPSGPNDENANGYFVRTNDVVSALRKLGRRASVDWLEEHVDSDAYPYCVFGKQFCEPC